MVARHAAALGQLHLVVANAFPQLHGGCDCAHSGARNRSDAAIVADQHRIGGGQARVDSVNHPIQDRPALRRIYTIPLSLLNTV
jgi:hypothetical protein